MLASAKLFLIKALDFFRFKKSYSQDGEDVALAAFYEGQKYYRGFFVDVGAHHPVRFSNTQHFYKRGWRGINIDPTPGSMRPFRLLRGRDVNLEMGVGPTVGELKFHCFNDPALNTFDEKLAAERNTGRPYRIVREVSVPLAPLADILEKHVPKGQTIDFFSIDVEGLDLEVLRSNDWERFSPRFLLVEDVHFDLENAGASQIFQFLKSKKYAPVAVLKRTIIYRKA